MDHCLSSVTHLESGRRFTPRIVVVCVVVVDEDFLVHKLVLFHSGNIVTGNMKDGGRLILSLFPSINCLLGVRVPRIRLLNL
jgi:hypothetical protein